MNFTGEPAPPTAKSLFASPPFARRPRHDREPSSNPGCGGSCRPPDRIAPTQSAERRRLHRVGSPQMARFIPTRSYRMILYILAFLIGIVAGLRNMTAPAAVSWAAYLGLLPLKTTPLAFFGAQIAPFLFTFLAIAEMIADLLPQTPSSEDSGFLRNPAAERRSLRCRDRRGRRRSCRRPRGRRDWRRRRHSRRLCSQDAARRGARQGFARRADRRPRRHRGSCSHRGVRPMSEHFDAIIVGARPSRAATHVAACTAVNVRRLRGRIAP